MKRTERLTRALSYLKEKNPLLARHLEQLHFHTLVLRESQDKKDNLYDKAAKTPFYLHSEESIEKETENWFKELDLENVQVLFLFGIGLGYLFEKLKVWLDKSPDHYLVILEDDPRVFLSLFETQIGEEILNHPKVRIELFTFDPKYKEKLSELLKHLSWYYIYLKMSFSALPSYRLHYKESTSYLRERLYTLVMLSRLHSYHYIDFGVAEFNNIMMNLLSLERLTHFNNLENSLCNIPAIIVGAGSSLSKNGSLLKDLSSKAVIFAGGSAIQLLEKGNLPYHIATMINPTRSSQPFLPLKLNEIPYIMISRSSSDVAALFHGPKILLSSGPSSFLEPILIPFTISEARTSQTVGDFSVQMALRLGCNPIILVGMDLALTENKYYAEGLDDPLEYSQFDLVKTHDIYNNEIFTKRDWHLSAKSIVNLNEEFEKTTIINATEGGVGFSGIENKPLSEVIKNLNTTYDIKSLIHSALQAAGSDPINKKEIFDRLTKIKKSLENALRHSETVKNDLMKTAEENNFNILSTTIPHIERELQAEYVYPSLLRPIWEIFAKILERTTNEIEQKLEPEKALWRLKLREVQLYIRSCNAHLKNINSLEENSF